jgi:hypothetical protein
MRLSNRAGLALAALAAPALAQATFTTVPGGLLSAVTPDGAFAVGSSSQGGFRYETATGTTLILGGQEAVGISTDGLTAFGGLDNPAGKEVFGLWTSGGGWAELGGLPGQTGCDSNLANPYALSDDGMTAVGLGWEGCKGRAVKWTPATGVVKLPPIGWDSSRANAVSGDGGYVGGWDQALTGLWRAAIWRPDGTGFLPLANTPGNPVGYGQTWSFSTDGTWASGDSASDEPFLYNNVTDTLEFLPILPEPTGILPNDKFQGNGVTDDGKLVVGVQGDFFGNPPRAWIWHEASGIHEVEDVLSWYGLAPPAGWFLHSSSDVSADGRTIVGTARLSPFPSESWVLELPVWPWDNVGGGTTGAGGVPELLGEGSLIPGTQTALRLLDGAASSPAVVAVSVGSQPIPLLGGTLHAFPWSFTLAASTDSDGALNVSFNWPQNSPSGSSLAFQVGVIDGTSPFGVVLSNGLIGTTL